MIRNFTFILLMFILGTGITIAQTTQDNLNYSGTIKYHNDGPTNITKGLSTCFALPSPLDQNLSNCDAGATPIAVDVMVNYAKLIFTDVMDTTYVDNAGFTYGPPVIDTTFNAHVYPGSDIVISEVCFDDDFVEIQNVSNSTIHTEDWFVIVTDDYVDINNVNTIAWILPDSIAPGEILIRDDNAAGTQYWGSNIMFSTFAGRKSWVMIIDNCGNIVDAYFHGWSKADINTMSITFAGFTIAPNSEWLGHGADNTLTTFSILRKGDTDNQMATDFDLFVATGSENPGTQYGSLTYPFTDITEIEVPITNSNSHSGIMFNIVAKEDIQIESFSPVISVNPGDSVKVYYIGGSYLNDMNSLANWNYAGFNEFSTAISGTMTQLPVGNIFVAKGDTVGIYLVNTTATPSAVVYSNGDTIKSDDFIEVIHGHGIASVGGSTYNPRYFVGKIHYNIGRDLSNNTATIEIANKLPVMILYESTTDNTNCIGDAFGSVDSLNIVEGAYLDEGAFDYDYTQASYTRGLGFIAPRDFNVYALKVPEMTVPGEVQNIQVVKFDASIGGTFTTLFYGNNLDAGNWVVVDLNIIQGDIIGILGARGTTIMHNAYGPETPYVSNVGGSAMDLNRIYYQDNLNATEALSSSIALAASGNVTQVDMIYRFDTNPNLVYNWDNGETTMLIENLLAGAYSLTVSNDFNCTDDITINIADGVNPVPVVYLGVDTTLCADESITLDAGAGLSSYNWTTGGTTDTELIDTSVVGGIGTFDIWVEVEDANGCFGYDTVIVTFEICTEIESINNLEVNLYPNPNNGEFNVDLSKLSGETNVIISNISGQVVKEIKSENSSTIINISLSNFEAGVYFISINNAEYRSTVKMMIK